MNLVTLREAAVEAIATRLPSLKQCEGHPGRFDLDELRRFLSVAPAVRVAILSIGGTQGDEEGLAKGDVRMAAFVVTRDARNLPKEDAALAIIEGLVPLIVENDWELGTVQPARDVKADNLYSTAIGKTGAMLWAVSWTQPAVFGEGSAEDDVMPEHLYVSMAPDIGLEHKQDYRDVQTGEAPPDD